MYVCVYVCVCVCMCVCVCVCMCVRERERDRTVLEPVGHLDVPTPRLLLDVVSTLTVDRIHIRSPRPGGREGGGGEREQGIRWWSETELKSESERANKKNSVRERKEEGEREKESEREGERERERERKSTSR